MPTRAATLDVVDEQRLTFTIHECSRIENASALSSTSLWPSAVY